MDDFVVYEGRSGRRSAVVGAPCGEQSGRFICFHSDEAERQANAFAAALLMPEKECQAKMEAYSDGNVVNMAKVADYFHVSIAAATNRGRGLGFL